MRSVHCFAIAVSCLLPGLLAHAQAAPVPPAPPTSCEQLRDFGPFHTSTTTKIEAIKDGCRFTDAVLDLGGFNRWVIAAIELKSPDLFASLTAGMLPADVNLTLEGVRLSPGAGPELSRYIVETQQVPFDAHLAYQHDAATGTLSLDDLSISGKQLGLASISARFSGIAAMPRELSDIAELPGLAIDSISTTLNNHGVFQSMLMPMIVGMLPADEDPRPAIASAQAALVAAITALPDTNADAASKAALSELVQSFPAPTGIYQLSVTLPEPLPVAALGGPGQLGVLAGLAAKLAITASHTPSAVR